MSKNKNGLLGPFDDFPGIPVHHPVVKVKRFSVLIGHAALTHEPPDMLDCGAAVKAVDGNPPVRVNHDDGGRIADECFAAVIVLVHLYVCVLVTIDFFDLHCFFLLLLLLSYPLGRTKYSTFFHINQEGFLDVKHLKPMATSRGCRAVERFVFCLAEDNRGDTARAVERPVVAQLPRLPVSTHQTKRPAASARTRETRSTKIILDIESTSKNFFCPLRTVI